MKKQFKSLYLLENKEYNIKTVKFVQLLNSIVDRKNGLSITQLKKLDVSSLKKYAKLTLDNLAGLSTSSNLSNEISKRYKAQMDAQRLAKLQEELNKLKAS